MLGLNWGGGISCGFACKVSVLFGLKLARVSDRFKGPRRKCKFFYMVTGRQWLDASPKGLQLGKPAECLNAHVMLVVCDQGFGQQNFGANPSCLQTPGKAFLYSMSWYHDVLALNLNPG